MEQRQPHSGHSSHQGAILYGGSTAAALRAWRSGSRAGRARIGLVVPGESHAGARQRGLRLSGLDWAAPKERITLPKHNAALYAEREESKEGSERRSEPTARISSAHLQGHRRTTNSPALVIRAMQSEGEQLSGRPVSGRGRREVRHTARFRSIRSVSFESIGLAVGLVGLVREQTRSILTTTFPSITRPIGQIPKTSG